MRQNSTLSHNIGWVIQLRKIIDFATIWNVCLYSSKRKINQNKILIQSYHHAAHKYYGNMPYASCLSDLRTFVGAVNVSIIFHSGWRDVKQ